MSKEQLFTLTNENYSLPFAVDVNSKVITMNASNIPMLQWPDKRWCFEANLYMLELFKRGLSRRNNGGTLRTYAANISHLIRYCYNNKINFIELTDSHFSLFIKMLQGERNKKIPDQLKRDANAVIHIGRNCLDFLKYTGRLHDRKDFVAKMGVIQSNQKNIEIKLQGNRQGKKIVRKYWGHHAFPTPDPYKKRLPIASADIKKLRQAIREMNNASWFLKRRKQVMLMLFEATGGRRSEVAALTIESVNAAQNMKEPLLKLITIKKRKDTHRYVPITRPDLDKLVSYIEKDRRRVIRNKIGSDKDHGVVLISESTGMPLKAATLSDEINALAKAAKLDGKACAHMFRHRFITKMFVGLIEQHEFNQADEFRKALIDVQTMKQKIQQWTGHTYLSSLDVYIDLAFDEVTHFRSTYDGALLRRVVDSVRVEMDEILYELEQQLTVVEAIQKMKKLLGSFDDELEKFITSK